jgi:type IV pilus assembly protein PilV
MRPTGVISAPKNERGTTLIEVAIALIILTVGIVAVAKMFPSAARSQVRSRMLTSGTYYAREKLEELGALAWADTALSAGRHPTGIATEDLGPTGAWHRYYDVSVMAAPLSDLKKVTVTVNWTQGSSRSTTTTTYLRK